jgi:hypothetical protein
VPTPQPTPAPALRTATAAARIAASRLDRRGRLRLTLRCPAGEVACAGRYRLMSSRGRTSLGSLRYTLAAGRRARHTVRLRARAISALRASGGRLRAVPVTGAAQTVRVARVPAA